MVWPQFDGQWDPWMDLRRWQREMNRVFDSRGRRSVLDFPPVNVWKSADGVVVTAEVPGMTSDDLDISVVKDTVTLRGMRKAEMPGEGKTFHRRERGAGEFVRSLQLPYDVAADKVTAKYEQGILRIDLPRAESEKPKRIAVK